MNELFVQYNDVYKCIVDPDESAMDVLRYRIRTQKQIYTSTAAIYLQIADTLYERTFTGVWST